IDYNFNMAHTMSLGYDRQPVDMFKEQCFITATYSGGRHLRHACDSPGAGNILWGSEFPFTLSTWPESQRSIPPPPPLPPPRRRPRLRNGARFSTATLQRSIRSNANRRWRCDRDNRQVHPEIRRMVVGAVVREFACGSRAPSKACHLRFVGGKLLHREPKGVG